MTAREAARGINLALRHELYVYLRREPAAEGIRIMRARSVYGNLHVKSLATGKWLNAHPDEIEVQGRGKLQ